MTIIVQASRDDFSLSAPAAGKLPEYASELPVLWVNPIPFAARTPTPGKAISPCCEGAPSPDPR